MSIRVTLNIEKENTGSLDLDMDNTAQLVCEKVLAMEDCPADTEISITYVDSDAIREINRDTRGIDAVTDVLSFPNLEFDPDIRNRGLREDASSGPAPSCFDEDAKAPGTTTPPAPDRWGPAMRDAWDCMDPETGNLFLGDIVLNLDRVSQQAQEYGHSERREFAFLIAHSMLHLCGYDHMTLEEEAQMTARQEAVLRELGITRE